MIAFALMCVFGVQAKGLKGKTIYLNPGHGGYTSGDRPTATINHEQMDTLSFYETRSNLWKVLEAARHLRRDGARVIMSRTRSGYVTQSQMDEGILNENQESHALPSEDKVDKRFNQVETTDDGKSWGSNASRAKWTRSNPTISSLCTATPTKTALPSTIC